MCERDRRIARRVAAKFEIGECEACAAEIIKALGRGSSARVLRIHFTVGSEFEFIGLAKTEALISYNGFHVGVQVGDRVFDNLHHEGVPSEEWLGRFIAETPLVMEERPVADFFGARFLRQRFRDWVG